MKPESETPTNDNGISSIDLLIKRRAEYIASAIRLLITAEIGKVVGVPGKYQERCALSDQTMISLVEGLIEFADDVRISATEQT